TISRAVDTSTRSAPMIPTISRNAAINVTRLFDVLPRRAALVTLAAGLIGLVAACDSAAPATPPTTHPAATPPPSTIFSNRDLPLRDGRRPVVLADLPPARAPKFRAPDNLLTPQSVPSGGSLVGTKRFWRVRMGINDARRWIADHPPVGLHPAGTFSGVMF